MKPMSKFERWLRHHIINSGMYNHGAIDMECPYCHNEVPVYPRDGMYQSTGCIKCNKSIHYLNVLGKAVQDTPETRELWYQTFIDEKAPRCRMCNRRHTMAFPEPTMHYPRYSINSGVNGKPQYWDELTRKMVDLTPEKDKEDGWDGMSMMRFGGIG